MLKLIYFITNLFKKKNAKVTIGNQIPYFPDDGIRQENSILDAEHVDELSKSIQTSYNWAVERIHTLNEDKEAENASAIQSEFNEWMDPEIPNHNIFHLEYLADQDTKGE